MDEIQFKYLERMIGLGYSNTEAMEALNKRVDKCENREKDETSETREVILSGRVLLDLVNNIGMI